MSLTPEEVEHIALLARLELTEAEKELYREQLSTILDHIAQLQKLDTSQVSPTSSVLPAHSRLREDEVVRGLTSEQAMRNAPQKEKGQFRVPPVLEQ
jgi:aspartyl-tRNA(Asn)/glutamyl-tRNA(Gln) amidotransferase subunit C